MRFTATLDRQMKHTCLEFDSLSRNQLRDSQELKLFQKEFFKLQQINLGIYLEN